MLLPTIWLITGLSRLRGYWGLLEGFGFGDRGAGGENPKPEVLELRAWSWKYVNEKEGRKEGRKEGTYGNFLFVWNTGGTRKCCRKAVKHLCS